MVRIRRQIKETSSEEKAKCMSSTSYDFKGIFPIGTKKRLWSIDVGIRNLGFDISDVHMPELQENMKNVSLHEITTAILCGELHCIPKNVNIPKTRKTLLCDYLAKALEHLLLQTGNMIPDVLAIEHQLANSAGNDYYQYFIMGWLHARNPHLQVVIIFPKCKFFGTLYHYILERQQTMSSLMESLDLTQVTPDPSYRDRKANTMSMAMFWMKENAQIMSSTNMPVNLSPNEEVLLDEMVKSKRKKKKLKLDDMSDGVIQKVVLVMAAVNVIYDGSVLPTLICPLTKMPVTISESLYKSKYEAKRGEPLKAKKASTFRRQSKWRKYNK